MNIKLSEVNEKNFWDVIKLKSDFDQEKRIQIFERWVGDNTFFLLLAKYMGSFQEQFMMVKH
ncbi:hypothetical protein V7122_24425 [Bacillus sp. JJ1532]|uniref:hypothetical protein n=1 Tax=unclassified Bacillus (in: firmicutes) TaxID=185979 RepID=UPI0030002A0A